MEGEIYNFICVWITIFVCLFFCHTLIGKNIPKGTIRLLALTPIICLFLWLPLNLTTMHFAGLSSFFIAWLANFKLLLFAFGKGPLSNPSNPSLPIPLHHFVAVACFPIRILNKPSPSDPDKDSGFESKGKSFKETAKKNDQKSSLSYAIKVFAFTMMPVVYEYKRYLHSQLNMLVLCLQIYLFLDMLLALFATLTKTLLGVELEPQFDKPHLAMSVQEFWGKRWNLIVASILRPTVYDPLKSISSRLNVPNKWSSLAPVFLTFFVSGLMHELIIYNMGRIRPTGEVTCCFIIHAVAVDMEIVLKKTLGGKFRVHPIISRTWTWGFLIFTTFRFFLPPFLQMNLELKACKEIVAFLISVRNGKLISPDDVSCPFGL